MSHISISHGLLDPFAHMGFGISAGIELSDGVKLYAIFETDSRRIMIVAHPARSGDMAAIALSSWTSPRPPLVGDLLDELIDPSHVEAIRRALTLLREGSL